MKVTRVTAIILLTLVLTAGMTVAAAMVQPTGILGPLASVTNGQGIRGDVSIGPVAPVCRVVPESTPTSGMFGFYSQNQVVIRSSTGLSLTVPLNWTLLDGCELHGTFREGLPAGTYSVDLTSCMMETTRSFSCATLPMTVVVIPDRFTHIEIVINTGIV